MLRNANHVHLSLRSTGFPSIPGLALAVVAAGAAGLLAAFAWQPSLATFADDSVSYLVMAQVFSPWQAATAPVSEAFAREGFYPPLFPLLLAVAGAGHNIALAHAVSALLLAACLPLQYVLAARWLGDRRAALMVAVAMVLLPALWIQAKGILSEPLYALLLLALLVSLDDAPQRAPRIGLRALLMAAFVLTRTAGLIVVAGYALWALSRRDERLSARLYRMAPAFAAVLAYALWMSLRPAGVADDYARIMDEGVRGLLTSEARWVALATLLARQANAIFEAWLGSLLLFWVEGRHVNVALAAVVGLLALGGLAQRLRQGEADGWMMVAYLLTYLFWPFYDQMTRFIFPALPVLLLYAFVALSALVRRLGRPAIAGQALLALLLASLALPGLAFIHRRAGAPSRLVEMTDWYRVPDVAGARARAEVHLDLLADMAAVRSLTRPEDRVMWVAPSYLALLADRRGVPAPDPALDAAAYRQAVAAARPDYVFLSVYHPRDSIRDTAWRAGLRALAGRGEIVHVRTRAGGTVVTSVLLKTRGESARPRSE